MLQEPRLEGSRREHVGRLKGRPRHEGFLLWPKGDFLHFEARVFHDRIRAVETDQEGIWTFNKQV